MKRLSEVCKIVGVTRRTLQEYDKIKLLSPTAKTEAGYWLYDNDAIETLIMIQTFIEAGYKRKAIKNLLKSPSFDILKELDNVISGLENKRKRIDGMISTINVIKLTTTLPESAYPALSKFDISSFYKDKSFALYLEEAITQASGDDRSSYECYCEWFFSILAIWYLVGNPEDSDLVQDSVERAFGSFKKMVELIETDEEDSIEDLTESEFAVPFLEITQEMAKEPEMLRIIESFCGVRAMPYIVRAVQAFSDKIVRQEGIA